MTLLQLAIIMALISTVYLLVQLSSASSDSGFSTGFEMRPDIENMSVTLYETFSQTSTNSTKDLHLEFFDEKNKTLIKNVSFFINATKDDNVLIHELFYTHTGLITLQFSPGSEMGKYVVNGTAEPVLGGMMSNNDVLPIEISTFTPGIYHIHLELLAVVHTNEIIDQTNPPKFDFWWSIDNKGNISKYGNNMIEDPLKLGNYHIINKILSPILQFKSGIAADDVICEQGFQLVIKAKDGSPACAKPHTSQKLVERKWGWAMQPIDSIKPILPNRIAGLENNTGLVIFGNQTYYFVTPNYTDTAYSNPVQISFHDVVFTLFPPGFRGGLPSGDCESYDTASGTLVGGGQYYWANAKFSDGTHELLHMFADSQPCPIYPKQTYFSNHANPQAGLTFYDGKMKLLVNEENPSSQSSGFDGVIIDQSFSVDHVYYFFTNDTSVKFDVGSEGIRLEGLDHVDHLNGKHVKIFGTIPMHQGGEDVIRVEKFQILGSFIPKGTTPTNMIQQVSFDKLLSNPDKYYNQTITVTGQLRENDYPLAITGVGCYSTGFTTSDEFIPDFVSRHQLYDGDRYMGVRIGGQYDLGYSESDKLPLDLKNKQVTLTGVFVPNIKDTGSCLHVLHKSGYILTDFKKISVTGN